MKNKILFLFILILTLSFSCAYAVDYQPEIEEKLTILENKGVVPQGFTQWVFNTSSYKTSLISDLKNSRYKGYCLIKTGSTGDYANRLFIYLTESTTITNGSNSTSNTYYNYWNAYGYIYNITSNSYSNSAQGSVKMNNVVLDYVYTTLPINTRQLTLGANEEHGGSYLSDSLEFTPYNNEVVSTNVNAIKNIYRFSVVSLGQITNYSENDRYNYVELLQNNNIVANMTFNNISKRINSSNNMDIESNDTGDIIRVNNWVLYLDELYTLNIYSGRRKPIENKLRRHANVLLYIFERKRRNK